MNQREILDSVSAGGGNWVGQWCIAAVAGICPIVKRIWTPAWVLFSGGWCFWLLAFFYGIIDMAAGEAWAFPLVVVGMNSIAIYCLVHLIDRLSLHRSIRIWGMGLF